MSKRADLPQSRRHVLIYDEDWEYLDAQYGRYSQSKLGTGVAVRRLIHRAVQQLRQLSEDSHHSPAPAPQTETETTPALQTETETAP